MSLPSSMTNKWLFLDLDLTVVSTQNSVQSLKDLRIYSDPNLMELRKRVYYFVLEDLERPGIGTKDEFWGVVRPHVPEFLTFARSYFQGIIVCTAGIRPYAEAIVDYLFKDLPEPDFVFSREDLQEDKEKGYIKSLEDLINTNPLLKKYISLKNALALDDTVETFSRNPDNGILIPRYEPALSVEAMSRDDPTLLQLKYWLLQPEVIESQDVRSLDKSKIFNTSVREYESRITGG